MKLIGLFFNFMVAASAVVLAKGDDIRDIKPPVNFPFNYKLLIVILSILILSILIFSIIFYLRRRKFNKEKTVTLPPKPAHIKALQALSQLYKKNLPALGKTKEFYFELSDIVRHYLEERFFLRGRAATARDGGD